MPYRRRRFLSSGNAIVAVLWLILAALSVPTMALAQFKMPDQKSARLRSYGPMTSGTAILKGNGVGGFANAISGTDYAPPTSSNGVLKGNGAGGFSTAVSGTDYVPPVDVNNHTTVAAHDASNDGKTINEIGTDAANVVHIGGGAASAISLDNSTSLNQGQFSAAAYLDFPVTNANWSGGTENCTQKWHVFTIAANATLTLSCAGNSNQTLDYLIYQPNTGSTFSYTFAAGNGAALYGAAPTPCAANGCVDQIEVTWVPSQNDYIVNQLQSNLTAVAACPAGQTCYYVAASGSDSNSGTDPNHPWLTTGKVESILATLSPGDEVLFHGGDTWTASASNADMVFGDTSAHAVAGSAAKPILFSTYGTGRAIIDANNTNPYCFGAYNPGFNVEYFTINNFECKHAWASAIYFVNSGGKMPGITISNNYVHNTGPGCATSNSGCSGLPPAWIVSHSYAAGSLIHPNANNSNGSMFVPRGACTSATSQPAWPQTIGSTVSDNSCTWTNVGSADDWLDWAGSTSYPAHSYIEPGTNNAGVFGARYVFTNNSSCTSGASYPTSWNQTVGGATSDNTCTWMNTGIAGHYKNQVGLEDDAGGADGVHILNNTVKWGGGHNLIEVHRDYGGAILQGNIVGPGNSHNVVDSHSAGTLTAPYQVIGNVATCGWSLGLCGCQQNAGCSNDTAAFFYDNEINATTSSAIYQLNVAYDSGIGFQVAANGNGTTSAFLVAKYYNNTAYLPTNISAGESDGIYESGGSAANSTIDLRNNIFDGATSHSVNIGGGWSSAIEDYNDIGGAQGSPGFTFNGGATKGSHDLTNVDPKYINASASPPNFGLQAGSPCLNAGLTGLTSGNSNIGAF